MLLSIIIPCYNSGGFIKSTLEMLIKQGLEDCEIIVVNDGSTDNTNEIVHSFAVQYKEITVISQENKGVAVARNVGLVAAQGQFVYFFDSDDYLETGSLDFFRAMLHEKKGHSLYCFGYCMRKNGKLLKDYRTARFNDTVMTGQV